MVTLLFMLNDLISGLSSSSNVKKAYRLASEGRFEEALTVLETVSLRKDKYTAVNVLGYIVKAICYAEINYIIGARACVKIILNMPATLNPFYMCARSNAKKLAKQIEEEYNL